MSFTNPPLNQNVAGGLGGRADAQLAREALRNQVQPSKDIMVSRTSGGTFLNLRDGKGGSGANLSAFTVESVSESVITADDGTRILMPSGIQGNGPENSSVKTQFTIRPEYKKGDVVYTILLPTKDTYWYASYLDVNVDARAWHYKLGVCLNKSMTYLWVSTQGFAR